MEGGVDLKLLASIMTEEVVTPLMPLVEDDTALAIEAVAAQTTLLGMHNTFSQLGMARHHEATRVLAGNLCITPTEMYRMYGAMKMARHALMTALEQKYTPESVRAAGAQLGHLTTRSAAAVAILYLKER